ncbi:MAG: large conductance mechanosensitive channel protein MscL [Defluviitaleaceae bacterium]|nr:large conductance mechanosensitive channel protein MscL [Defluviitaleaceae bacterium]
MRKFFYEFKDFALRGNMMSMAVGVIIGAAFQGLITSLTDNILSPIIGLFTRQNFDLLELHAFGVVLRYGAFLTALINFVIMAFVVFLMIRGMNYLLALGHKKEQAKAEAEPNCPYCKTVVHKEAIRCPACTSEISEIKEGAL